MINGSLSGGNTSGRTYVIGHGKLVAQHHQTQMEA
jgi:hypothetical protein